MSAISLRYDTHNTQLKSIPEVDIVSKELTHTKSLHANDDVLKMYQRMFGKRKDNKYTDKEIFLFNSKLNASKTFAKYL